MSMAKRELEQHEDMRAAVKALGIEEKALVYDEDSDEVSSAEDEEANKAFYARAFKEWAEGKLKGDAKDIFDAVNDAIEA